ARVGEGLLESHVRGDPARELRREAITVGAGRCVRGVRTLPLALGMRETTPGVRDLGVRLLSGPFERARELGRAGGRLVALPARGGEETHALVAGRRHSTELDAKTLGLGAELDGLLLGLARILGAARRSGAGGARQLVALRA